MLKPGKLPRDVLEELLSVLGDFSDPSLVLGPGEGLDAAVVRLGDKTLVMASDPVTGAGEGAGFYAVHVNANDVAVLGAKPRWMLVTILLPEGSDRDLPVKIEKDIKRAAEELCVTVVGGHTEVTPGIRNPIVSGAMIGTVRGRLVLPNGAREGDAIVMTKWAGLEGTSIIARERRKELQEVLGKELVERAASFSDMISVVKEALLAAELGARAMHDPTEGGLANGLHEMADSSGLGFRVFADRIPVREETLKICDLYGLDPLSLLGSGSLLAAVPKSLLRGVLDGLKRIGVKATAIGEFTGEERVIVTREGEREMPRPESDEIWKIVS